jgi:hypothetical protein
MRKYFAVIIVVFLALYFVKGKTKREFVPAKKDIAIGTFVFRDNYSIDEIKKAPADILETDPVEISPLVEQRFRAKTDGLNRVSVRLKYDNNAEKYEKDLSLRLAGPENNIIFEKTVSAKYFSSGDYFPVEFPKIANSGGKNYILSLQESNPGVKGKFFAYASKKSRYEGGSIIFPDLGKNADLNLIIDYKKNSYYPYLIANFWKEKGYNVFFIALILVNLFLFFTLLYKLAVFEKN